MKRILSTIFLAIIIIASQPFAQAHGQEAISVLVDGLTVKLDVLPVVQNDRTLIPLRFFT